MWIIQLKVLITIKIFVVLFRSQGWMETIGLRATRWWRCCASTETASWLCWRPSSTTPCWTGGLWTVCELLLFNPYQSTQRWRKTLSIQYFLKCWCSWQNACNNLYVYNINANCICKTGSRKVINNVYK